MFQAPESHRVNRKRTVQSHRFSMHANLLLIINQPPTRDDESNLRVTGQGPTTAAPCRNVKTNQMQEILRNALTHRNRG